MAIPWKAGKQTAGTEVIDAAGIHWIVLKDIKSASIPPKEGIYYKQVKTPVPVPPVVPAITPLAEILKRLAQIEKEIEEMRYTIKRYSESVPTVWPPVGGVVLPPVIPSILLPALVTLTSLNTVPFMADPPYLERGRFDPVFGNEIIKIGGGAYGSNMHYSKTGPTNCDQTLVLLGKGLRYGLAGGFAVIHSSMGGWFGTNPQWSYTDPNKFYMVTVNGTLDVVNAIQNTRETLYDFKVNDSAGKNWGSVEGTTSLGSSEGSMSRDNRFIVVQGKYGTGGLNSCCGVFDMVLKQFISPIIDVKDAGYYDIDFCTISPSGNYVYVRARPTAGTSVGAVERLYTKNMVYINTLPAGSHQDMGYDANGNEVYGHVNSNTGYTKLADVTVSTPGVNTPVITDSAAIAIFGNYVSAGHTSFRHYNLPGYIGIGGWGPGNEALLLNMATGQARRFCHMRGTGSPKTAEMTPSWSPNGDIVFFKSDWGVSGGTVYTYACLKSVI